MKNIKKYQSLIYILLIICAAFILIFRVFDMRKPKSIAIERKSGADEKVPTIDDEPTIDFKMLRTKYNNKDIKGAIRIKNDNFEEIIFQSNDDEYYLKHNYRGKKTNGEIFISSKLDLDDSNIKLINTEATIKSKVLNNYYDKKYYENHKFIEIETDKSIYKYEVLSIVNNKVSYDNFDIEKVLKNSSIIYSNDVENINDYLIIINKKDNSYYSIICKKVN